MPIYDYECENCGLVSDVWARMDEDPKLCWCGAWMKRLISATRSNPDWQPYFDENLCPNGCGTHEAGTWVKSRQHRIETMRRLGLTNQWGEGMPQRWV